MSNNRSLMSALESMMFVWGQPLETKVAAEVLNMEKKQVLELFKELQREYEEEHRGIVIRQIENSFQFVTREENIQFIEKLCTPVKTKKLSQAALEVLAIVAYKQPVTKGEIEAIRGIKCDRVMEGLVEKGLVESVGRSEGIGRPMLYGTTEFFLKNFGFSNIKELPEIENIEEAINSKYSDEIEEITQEDCQGQMSFDL